MSRLLKHMHLHLNTTSFKYQMQLFDDEVELSKCIFFLILQVELVTPSSLTTSLFFLKKMSIYFDILGYSKKYI